MRKNNKNDIINQWKRRGLVDDYEKVWNIYINTYICDNCKNLFNDNINFKKCMDHNHQTGKFRNILCRNCNLNLYERTNKKLYLRGIYSAKKKHGLIWRYEKKVNKKRYVTKYYRNKINTLCHKYIYILKIKSGII